MSVIEPKPTTHFDVMLEKVRGALQEYEDDWRAGHANGVARRDEQIDAFEKREPLVQEVIKAHKALNAVVAYRPDSNIEPAEAALFEALEALRKWTP